MIPTKMKLVAQFLLALFLTFPAASMGLMLGLSQAVGVSPAGLSGPEKRPVALLREDVEKRTQILWPAARVWPDCGLGGFHP